MILSQPFTNISEQDEFFIDIRKYLDVYLKYSPWENGLKIHRYYKGKWEIENRDPDLPLLNEAHELDSNLPVHQFIKKIPEQIRSRLSTFNYLQTTMLQIAALSENARELISDIPILLWLIAEKLNKGEWSFEKCEIVLNKKRKSILKHIFGNGSKADIKSLRKIRLMHGERDELKTIKTALENNSLGGQLNHWNTIPVQIIALLQRFPNLSDASFIKQISLNTYDRIADSIAGSYKICKLWDDIYQMGNVLEIENIPLILNQAKTIDALKNLHDRWMNRLHMKDTIISRGKPFLPPPIPGNENIYPIQTFEDLLAEGKLMNHCVGGYVHKVQNGTSYIYRVLYPQRATLEIIGKGKNARIGEFKRAYNQSPSNKTMLMVADWLEKFKKSIGSLSVC